MRSSRSVRGAGREDLLGAYREVWPRNSGKGPIQFRTEDSTRDPSGLTATVPSGSRRFEHDEVVLERHIAAIDSDEVCTGRQDAEVEPMGARSRGLHYRHFRTDEPTE